MGALSDPTRLWAIPVSVPDQDRVLLRRQDFFVAAVGVRAYPQAVMLQLLVKARFADGEVLDLAPYPIRPGKFEFGADLRDAVGVWQQTSAQFAGGGGGNDSGGGGHYEFKWWVPVSDDSRGLRLWCAWEERDIPRSTAELDLDRILTAARASRPAWPT